MHRIRTFIFFISCLLLGGAKTAGAAIGPPEIRCISVTSGGNIEITWRVPPGSPTEFIDYIIYSSSGVGPYQKLDSVSNFNQNFYTDVNSVGQIDYFIRTKYNDGSGPMLSTSSDTVSNIVLNINGTLPPTLNWNQMRQPNISTNNGRYRIYRKKNQGGAWVLIDSTNYGNESYVDNSIVVCSDSLYYRVETDDDLPCTSVSSVAKNLFAETTPPNIPDIDTVSVDYLTGHVNIGWQPTSSPDAAGYVVFYDDNGSWVRLDTVFGVNTTTFTDTSVNANSGTQQYTIAPLDTCGNQSAEAVPHTTMHVTGSGNYCTREIRLEWTPYVGWEDVSSYAVYHSVNNGPFAFVANVDGGTTTYTHADIEATAFHRYYILASRGSRTSRSGLANFSFTSLERPEFHYTTYATVTENDQVEVQFVTDTSADVDYFMLKRALERNGPYINVARMDTAADTVLTFIDSTARPSQTAYYYSVESYDSCGAVLLNTNISRTIHLTVEDNRNTYVHSLEWNRYIGWDTLGTGVSKYRVYYGLDSEFDGPIDSVAPGDRSYLNPYFENRMDGGRFCYYVEAQETFFNYKGFRSRSRSNIACIDREAILFIPNAFTPNNDGANDLFIPEIQFVDPVDFQMVIYDRWGRPVAEISDPGVGWDGTIGTEKAPIGTYVYYITLTTTRGATIEKRGGVTLIR